MENKKSNSTVKIVVFVLLILCCMCTFCAGACLLFTQQTVKFAETEEAKRKQQQAVEQQQKEDAASAAKAEDERMFNNPVKVPASFDLEGVTWKVTKVEDRGSKLNSLYPRIVGPCTLPGDQKYVFISYEVTNNRKQAVTYLNSNSLAIVLDKDRKGYSASTTGDFYNCVDVTKQNYLGPLSLNPNTTEKFIQIYKLPTSAKDLRLKVSADKGEAYKYVKLGN